MSRNLKKVRLGALDDFAMGKFTMRKIGSREIGIIRLRDGTFRAVLNSCPHKGAAICKGFVGGTWPPSAPSTLSARVRC